MTSGLIAYLDGEPAGWCAVEPRTAYEGLVRNNCVPWVDRAEDKNDDSVWAVTCIFTRGGLRKRGVSKALVRAAVEFARERGARAIEGYPMSGDRRGFDADAPLPGLRDAGVIRQREEGNRRWTTLRYADLEARFPGMLDSILRVSAQPSPTPAA